MLRVAAMPAGRRLRKAPHAVDHGRLQRRRPSELQPEVAREPGGGDHVHLLADPDAVRRDEQVDRGLARRRRRRAVEQPAQPRAQRRGGGGPIGGDVDHDRRRPRPCRVPGPRGPGPICQWPGRTARSRISSTVVRVGPAPNPTSVRSLRATISSPLNGAQRDLHRHRRVAHRAERVRQLLADGDAVLVDRRLELRADAPCTHRRRRPRRSGATRARLTSPSLRRRSRAHAALLLLPRQPLPPLHRVEDLLGLALASDPWARAAGGCGCGACGPPLGGGGVPPPPLCGGGGGRRRSASSRFHLARADEGCSSSAWRSRSAASSSSSSWRERVGAGREQADQAEIVERPVAQVRDRATWPPRPARRARPRAGRPGAPRCPRCRTRCPWRGRCPPPSGTPPRRASDRRRRARARRPSAAAPRAAADEQRAAPASPISAGPGRAMV